MADADKRALELTLAIAGLDRKHPPKRHASARPRV